MSFALSHRSLDATTIVVTLQGELELSAAPTFKRDLLELRRAGYRQFILDFANVTFFDSTALGVLIGFSRRVEGSGTLALTDLPAMVRKVLEVTSVDRRLNIFPTATAAIEQLAVSGPSCVPDGGAAVPADVAVTIPEPKPTSPPAQHVNAPLTEDAAVVLGIAATAIEFAPTLDAQAERWLRALSSSGDAGFVLAVLGASEDSLEPAMEQPDPADAVGEAPRRDVVATVTRSAREIAEERRHQAIHTDDLLGAVADVYGPVFDRVLARHGVGREELLAHAAAAGTATATDP
jgi:anti-sigma B factor antagonist